MEPVCFCNCSQEMNIWWRKHDNKLRCSTSHEWKFMALQSSSAKYPENDYNHSSALTPLPCQYWLFSTFIDLENVMTMSCIHKLNIFVFILLRQRKLSEVKTPPLCSDSSSVLPRQFSSHAHLRLNNCWFIWMSSIVGEMPISRPAFQPKNSICLFPHQLRCIWISRLCNSIIKAL